MSEIACGMQDVRLREDGQYVCRICGKKLGKEFDKRVALLAGPYWASVLKTQCAAPKPETKP